MGIFFTKIEYKIIQERTSYYKRQRQICENLKKDSDFLIEEKQKIKKLIDEAVSNQDYEPDQDELQKRKEEEQRAYFLNLKNFEKADFLNREITVICQKNLIKKEEQQAKIDQLKKNLKTLDDSYKKRLKVAKKLQKYLEKK